MSETITSGGEHLDIYEIMQRFRNDGSCEHIITDALKQFAARPKVSEDDEKVARELVTAYIKRRVSDGSVLGRSWELIDRIASDRASVRDAARRECAGIAEAMRPTGGRMWTDEQHACYEALNACAAAILERVGKPVRDSDE